MIVFCLVGLVCGLMSARQPWIEPKPGVRLKPALPILRREDIAPGSAFDLFERAATFLSTHWGQNEYDELQLLSTSVWSDAVFTGLVASLAVSSTNLALARQAVLAGEIQVPTLLSYDTPLPYISGVSESARFFRVSAIRDASQGDCRKAFSDLATAIRFCNMPARGGASIHHAIGMNCSDFLCDTMLRIASCHRVPNEVLVEAAKGLRDVEERLEPLAEAFRHECLLATSIVDEAFIDPEGTLGYHSPPIMKVAIAVAPLLGSTPAVVKRNLAHCYSHLVYLAENPEESRSREELEEIFENLDGPLQILCRKDPVGYTVSALFVAGHTHLIDQRRRTVSRLRQTRVFLAVTAFQQAHDRVPGALEKLVPEFLDGVPADIYDGDPLRYVVAPDGRWRVYSIGSDKTDDGGVGTMNDGGPDYTLDSEAFIVPSPAATNPPAASPWHAP